MKMTRAMWKAASQGYVGPRLIDRGGLHWGWVVGRKRFL